MEGPRVGATVLSRRWYRSSGEGMKAIVGGFRRNTGSEINRN